MRRELELEQKRREEETEKWEKMTESEKIDKIKGEGQQNTMISREEKIRRAREGRKRWKEWRENEDSKEGEEETEEMEEDTARGELVLDPETRTYDARKMKVTNLRENTRITLPRPLKPIHEAMIEVRRKEYNRVFDEYRGKESKKRKRVTNLTEEESKGVKSLKSRIEKDEIVVLKTDKSSKLTIMNKEEYRETGEKLREKIER